MPSLLLCFFVIGTDILYQLGQSQPAGIVYTKHLYLHLRGWKSISVKQRTTLQKSTSLESIHKCLPQPGCRGHSTLWRWWWRRSTWRWRWWWSSRAGTAPPFFRSIWSLPRLALDLPEPPSWRWKAEPLLQVQLRPRRWFSSSCRCTWRSWPTTRSRWRPSATSTLSPTCSRKITWASSSFPWTSWKIYVYLVGNSLPLLKKTRTRKLTQCRLEQQQQG